MSGSKINLAFFASGNGSALRHVHGLLEKSALPFSIRLIITNNSACGCAQWAREQDLPVAAFERTFAGEATDEQCLEILRKHKIDLIILGGFLRKVGPRVLAAFAGRIFNVHPALLPKFGGRGMYGRHVHEAVLAAGESHTGATLHRVDAAYDEGAIILQKKVETKPDDTADRLGDRVIRAEAELLRYFLNHYAGGNVA